MIRLSLTASYIVESNIEIGKQILRLYKQFADTERMLRNVGENMTIEVMTWDNSMINSDDVYVDSHSASIESLAQRRNMVFDLLGAGLFNDPETGMMSKETIAKVFDLIELGNWEIGNDFDKLHISKVERENDLFINGNWKDIDSYDDHLIHIKEHNRYRLTANYERIVAENPNIDVIFEYHVMQHIDFIRSQTQQAQEEIPQSQQEINIEGDEAIDEL